ncbi:MAG: cardiolipin synthase [Deltaproteobacteria bacterium]|nr:cardiolipin synthase [Deltaproteobacteria bacterium]
MSVLGVAVVVGLAVQLAVIFGFVLLERRQPAATLAWIFGVLFMPILGVLLYLMFGLRRTIKRSRKAERLARRTAQVFRRYAVATHRDAPEAIAARAEPLVALGMRVEHAPASYGNAVDVLRNAGATYRAMLEAIRGATDHVHVLFYIIQPDETGRTLRSALVERAREGVQVRVLCDAIGSTRLPNEFWAPLREVGGVAEWFAPVRFMRPRMRRRDHINFRNHRKIVVVDGHVGLTGGINIGREYLGLDPAVGNWRDSHLRVEGPAVVGLQQTFIEDWLAATGELLDAPRYFPTPKEPLPGDHVVQIIASGPDRQWSLIHRLNSLAISQGRRRVWVTSPYFVPDRVIQQALTTAALCGLDTRLLVPARSDSRLVDWAARSYYGELLDAGVRIFVYERGFLHAKTLIVDDWLGSIGSANMDMRSFHLNYELNAFVYGRPVTEELAQHFLSDLEGAHELPRTWSQTLTYPQRLLHATAGLMSPLL